MAATSRVGTRVRDFQDRLSPDVVGHERVQCENDATKEILVAADITHRRCLLDFVLLRGWTHPCL